MKIIFVATVGSHIALFYSSFINELTKRGHIVDAAFYDDSDIRPNLDYSGIRKTYELNISRNPFSKSTFTAYKEIKHIVKDGEYDVVHCSTPIAGFCTRFACNKLRRHGLRVIYTAHGFHFFSGAPLKNWLLYYPAEWICARKTDCLITINNEDYKRAKKHMHAKHVEFLPGVGIDVERFANTKREESMLKKELDLPADAKIVVSVGELNKNKNQELVIKALSKVGNRNLHYVVVGEGDLFSYLKQVADQYGVGQQVHFVGFRKDIESILKSCDFYVQPSLREGLPVALMEALASGVPCIASDIRGCRDLLDGDKLFSPNSVDHLARLLKQFAIRPKKTEFDASKYSIENVNKLLIGIFDTIDKDN